MEESPVDSAARTRRTVGLLLALAYFALLVYLLMHPGTRIIGVLSVPIAGALIAWYFVPTLIDDTPQWWRRLVYRGWHGRYRAFEDQRVRVIDGERDTPSQVFAADIFDILGEAPSAIELAKLEARYGAQFARGTEGLAEGEWLFTDAACMAYVRGQMDDQRTPRGRDAHKLALWLERSVFMPIDNRRTAATGKIYPFTKEAARR
jgi:hypothetical protein